MPGMASSHRKPLFGFAVARFLLCTCHFLVAAAALVQSHAEQAPKGTCGPVLGKSGAGDRRAMWARAGDCGIRGAWPRMECPGLIREAAVPAGSLFALMRGSDPLIFPLPLITGNARGMRQPPTWPRCICTGLRPGSASGSAGRGGCQRPPPVSDSTLGSSRARVAECP